MMIMDEDKLPPELLEAIADWFEGFELVEFLDISSEDVVDAFEEQIKWNLDAIKAEIHWKDEEDEPEDSE